jgi:hypothetical protein
MTCTDAEPATATTTATSSDQAPPNTRCTSSGDIASSRVITAAASTALITVADRSTGKVGRSVDSRLLTSRLVSCSTAMKTPGPTTALSRYNDATAAYSRGASA